MTFKSIMNFGGFGGTQSTAMDRYHSGPSGYDHGYRHGGYKGGGGKGGGGSGAALSALTLLAFLFLLNVMQQSLRDNNSTTTAATILLKEDLPRAVSLSEVGEDKANERKDVGAHFNEEYLIPVRTTSRDKRSEI